MNSNVPFIIRIIVDGAVGGLIRNSDPTVQAKRSNTVIAVASALLQVNAGNVTTGLQALEAALEQGQGDPAVADELQTLILWGGSKAAAVQQLLEGSIGGEAIGALNDGILNQAITVAKSYLPATASAK